MYVLGIHDGHNSSAVLLQDGRVLAGVQEERPLGVKNALGLPRAAVQDVLSYVGLKPADVDWVALSGLHGGEYLDLNPSVKPAELILKWHQAGYEQHPLDPKSLIRRCIPHIIQPMLHLHTMVGGNSMSPF